MGLAGIAFGVVDVLALAEATSDLVPYLLLAFACLATLAGLLHAGESQRHQHKVAELELTHELAESDAGEVSG